MGSCSPFLISRTLPLCFVAIHLFKPLKALRNLRNVSYRLVAQNKILAITKLSGKINSAISLVEGASLSGKLVLISLQNLDIAYFQQS